MEMEKKIFEAALVGDVACLKELMQQDPLILDRVTPTLFQDTPLHVAILRGQLEFARAVLSHSPRLAIEPDSLGHLPLHVASAKGHVAIIRELLRVGPASSCLARSKDGKLPLHLAIMKGVKVEVVSELARASPESVRLRVGGGDSVLHLCVKYENLEALKVLVEMMRAENDGSNLLNARNDDGNTVLHLAALYKHLEMTKYLLATPGIEQDAVNNNGLTALDLVENSSKDIKGLELLNFLLQSKVPKSTSNIPPTKSQPSNLGTQQQSRPNKSWKTLFTFSDHNINQLETMKGEILIGAAIIATINSLPIIYMRVNGPDIPDQFSINSASFVPAVSVMLLLIGGLPLRNKLCAWLVVQLMYTALGFMGLNYIGEMLSNDESRYSRVEFAVVFVSIWFVVLMILSALNVIRLIDWIVKSIKGRVKQRRLRCNRENAMSNA